MFFRLKTLLIHVSTLNERTNQKTSDERKKKTHETVLRGKRNRRLSIQMFGITLTNIKTLWNIKHKNGWNERKNTKTEIK